MREKGLCVFSLESGHVAKFCKKSYYCKRCNGKHNILVCTFKKAEEPPNDAAESIAINLNHAENGNLIQTAIAMVSNLSNTKSDNSSVIFDAGRALFNIIAKKINLPTTQKKSFYINVFGNSESTLQKFDMVAFKKCIYIYS